MESELQATLVVRGGPNSGAIVALVGGSITMGRRSDNDIVVDETTVSRRHSLIMNTPGGYVVRDLNTTNGTFVNQNKLNQSEHVLRHGDQIKLGGSDITIMFRQEGPRTLTLDTASSVPVEAALPSIPEQTVQPAAAAMLEIVDATLLSALGLRKGSVVSRSELLEELWPDEHDDVGKSLKLDEAVARLRSQLDQDPDNPVSLVTVGQFGYLLV
ncbi:MAG: FHA domain-containing protein [Dehalococcoidia bacterium]|nr:FHA domain-containing protein [Dehalococcoidia bacterium]